MTISRTPSLLRSVARGEESEPTTGRSLLQIRTLFFFAGVSEHAEKNIVNRNAEKNNLM